MEKLRIVVGGFLGILPAGGVTWDYLQYPLGLALLGHDVHYIEDTRLYPIYQKPGSDWNDSSACVAHLRSVMEAFGFAGRWAYRDEASGQVFGLSEKKLKAVCRQADVFLNLSCAATMRDEYAAIPAKVLVDTDPMFTQVQVATQQAFTPGQSGLKALVEAHNHHFSFGENIGNPGCRIPLCGIRWQPTRQPVCLPYWKPQFGLSGKPSFTTLMNWTAAKPLVFEGESWGQKDRSFRQVVNLPKQVPEVALSLVVNRTGNVASVFPKEEVEANGWTVLDPDAAAGDWRQYQRFIADSWAEFSVAKQTYVAARTGWFSCRSACYLASGKPVVTEETGWSAFVPQGLGLLAFSDAESAADAIRHVVADYSKHCRAARQVAEDFFDSRLVLNELLERLSTQAIPQPQNAATA